MSCLGLEYARVSYLESLEVGGKSPLSLASYRRNLMPLLGDNHNLNMALGRFNRQGTLEQDSNHRPPSHGSTSHITTVITTSTATIAIPALVRFFSPVVISDHDFCRRPAANPQARPITKPIA